MSVLGKTVYRVRQIVSNDVAIISEVNDGETNGGGKLRETRDSRIVLGGTDSFWLVTGEKKEQKFVLKKDDAPLPTFVISPMTSLIRGSSVFELPKMVNESSGPGKFDAVSFASATRLAVGYSPHHGVTDDRLAALSQGMLQIPLETAVSAIEVRPGLWLTSGFNALPAGRYGLRQPSLRSVATASLDNRPDMIRLAHGILVFVSQPKWSEPKNMDLRPEEEIIKSAERWLARSKSAVTLSDGSGVVSPADLLRMLTDCAVTEEERVDIAAVAGILSHRSDLIDILPGILGRDPAFKDMMAAFERSEKDRLRSELEGQVLKETEAGAERLTALRNEIADAESRIAAFSHRENLLRAETEKHDDILRRKIAGVADEIRDESVRETARIREEFGRLKEEVAQITQAAPAAVAPVAFEQAEDVPEAAPLPAKASDDQRQMTVRELSVATGLPTSAIAAIVAASTDVVPVLVFPDATAAAVDIATAISGDDAAIVFCDPTKISLADLLSDEHSGLKAAIDKARSQPDVLGAVALCGITSGPCEHWLPQLLQMRRVGRLPRNLALIASAGMDGMRVSVPDSVLRHLFPLEATKAPRPGSAKFGGLWPMKANPDQDRLREAVECLVDGGLEGAALQNAARMLARAPAWMEVADLKDVFLRQAKWLAAVDEAADHEHNKHFIDIEG